MATKNQSKAESVKVGHEVDVAGKGAFVRYPDGTVATARSVVTFTKPGTYAVIVGEDETAYEVAAS